MSNYINKSEQTKGSGNRYKAMNSFPYTQDEAIHWIGGEMPELENLVMIFLLKNKLQPTTKFLEFGPGPLRCSKKIIDYLNKDHYFAVEGDASLIEVGKQSLSPEQLAKNPQFVCSWNFEVEKLGQDSFDMVFVQGVICHMPFEEIEKLFDKIATFLSPLGEAHLSYLSGTMTDFHQGFFYQTFEQLESLAILKGLSCKNTPDWGHPRGLQMITLRKN